MDDTYLYSSGGLIGGVTGGSIAGYTSAKISESLESGALEYLSSPDSKDAVDAAAYTMSSPETTELISNAPAVTAIIGATGFGAVAGISAVDKYLSNEEQQ